MTKKIYAAFASLVAIGSALAFAGPAGAAAHDGHRHRRDQQHAVKRGAGAAQARRKVKRRAISYACPMHPDVRSKSRGECPKCGMELVAVRRGAKAAPKRAGASSGEAPATH